MLERKQFVRRERRSSVGGETQYAFLHLVIRDVAYGQIPRAERAEKHRLAAEWIQSLTPDRSEDRAEMLAHHYLAALELFGSAGVDTASLAAPARDAFREAGDRALGVNAFGAAERYYGAALDPLCRGTPGGPLPVRAGAGDRAPVRSTSTRSVKSWQGSSPLAMSRAQPRWRRTSGPVPGIVHRESADGHLDQAWPRRRGPSPAKVRILAERARFRLLAGDNEGAIRAGEEVLPLAEQLGLDDVRAVLLIVLGTARVAVGDELGLADLEQSLAIGLEFSLGVARAPGVQQPDGELQKDGAIGRVRRSPGRLSAARTSVSASCSSCAGSWAKRRVDRYRRGDGIGVLFCAGDVYGRDRGRIAADHQEPLCRWVRAYMTLARGDVSRAGLEDSARKINLAREHKDLEVLAPALAQTAFVLVALGRSTEASDLVDELLALPLFYSSFIDLAWALAGHGRGGEFEQRAADTHSTPWRTVALEIAAGRFEAAADVLAEMGDVADEAYARLRSGNDDQVRRALAFYRSVGATRYIEEGEAPLAATA